MTGILLASSSNLSSLKYSCTAGSKIASYMNQLALPVTYHDLEADWKTIGKPQVLRLRHADLLLMCEYASWKYAGDLASLVAAQKHSLKFQLSICSKLGIQLPCKVFTTAALYIHYRSLIRTEVSILKNAWPEDCRAALYDAFWRQDLASFDIDRARCASLGHHECLIEVLWGEMASMSTETIHHLYTEFASRWLRGKVNLEYDEDLTTSCVSTSGSQDFCSWTQRHIREEGRLRIEKDASHHGAYNKSLDLSSMIRADNIGFKEKDNGHCHTASPSHALTAAHFLHSVKRRHFIADGAKRWWYRGNLKSLSAMRDMLARFQVTFQRFGRTKVVATSLHTNLRTILTRGRNLKECELRNLLQKSFNDKVAAFDWYCNVLEVLAAVAKLLVESQMQYSNNDVLHLTSTQFNQIRSDCDLRYRHALLDTWHLYRSQWTTLMQDERRVLCKSGEKASIKALVKSLRVAE